MRTSDTAKPSSFVRTKMKLLYVLCVYVLLVSADDANYGQCEINKNFCASEDSLVHGLDSKKLLFYDVNPPEGFNLRRDVYMRFAIMLAEAQKLGENMNWSLILPPWYAIYHWKTESFRNPPKPWNMFFDVPSLQTYVPVMELHQIMQNSGRYGLKIDSLYILHNYDDPFEDGEFKDKWNILGHCQYEGHFWGYQNITADRVICVEFQGTITQIWDIINQHPEDRKVMFWHGEIPLHSSYGSKTYWDCRKSMKFNSHLIRAASMYIENKFNCVDIKCSNYLSIHWRRQDFYRANRSTSMKETAKQINRTVKNKSLELEDIFIASDGTSKELKLLEAELKTLGYNAHFYEPNVRKYTDGQIAIIEQIICSRSAYFIGTHESTFTYRIQEEREILGFNSDTTFNRLCPDVGDCERPSRWTIIH